MVIKINRFKFTECWDGVLYKNLSDYPRITDWEIQSLLDFMVYEEMNGRSCRIEAESSVLEAIERFIQTNKGNKRIAVPPIITECTACPTYKGCMTEYVCHTASAENAVKILDCGSLLSAVKARNMPASLLKAEARNAANDPEDYFDYVMFAWGNCQAGDRLVMERKLGRSPTEEELSTGFTPGIIFFFRYDVLTKHPDAIFDGVLPVKVKNGVKLNEYVHSIIIPTMHKEIIIDHIPDELRDRVHFLENDCRDIWEWSEKVYEYIKSSGN